MGRGRAGLVGLLLTVMVLGVLVAGAARASAATGSWASPVTIENNYTDNDVSCASQNLCVAIDDGPNGDAEIWNGTSWSAPEPIDSDGTVVSVSCAPGTDFCAAVDADGGAVTYDGSSWSQPVLADPSGAGLEAVSCWAAGDCIAIESAYGGWSQDTDGSWSYDDADQFGPVDGGTLWSLSCASASFCVAGGRAQESAYGDWSAVVWMLTPGSGGTPQWSTTGDDIGDNEYNPISAVSCPSTGFCEATDRVATYTYTSAGGWSGPTDALSDGTADGMSCPQDGACTAVGADDSTNAGAAWSYANSSWTSTPVSVGSDGNLLSSVSCPSTGFCMALTSGGSAVEEDNGSWQLPVSIDPAGGYPSGIACASTVACTVVDSAGLAIDYNAGAWAAAVPIDSPLSASAGGDGTAKVSCPAAGTCAAVDSLGDAMTESDGRWSAPDPIDTDSYGGLSGVSCPSAGFCAAVDADGNAFTYSSGHWSAAIAVGGAPQLEAVSCASASFCVAVGYPANGDSEGVDSVYATTPSSPTVPVWGAQQTVASAAPFASVSCPTANFCMAIDSNSNAFTFNGSHWTSSPVAISGLDDPQSVSCSSADFCAATDESGNASIYNGTEWSDATFILSPGQSAVSCPADGFCVATGLGGQDTIYSTNGTSSGTSLYDAGGGGGTPPPTGGGGGGTSPPPSGGGGAPPPGGGSGTPGGGSGGGGSSGTGGSGATGSPPPTGGGSTGSGAGGSSPAPQVGALSIKSVKAVPSGASVLVRCAGSGTTGCAGKLVLTVVEKLRGHRVIKIAAARRAAKKPNKPKVTTRTVTVGSATVSIAANGQKTVTVKLNATGARLLKSHKRLKVKLSATSLRAGSAGEGGHTLVITAGKTKRKAIKKKSGHAEHALLA